MKGQVRLVSVAFSLLVLSCSNDTMQFRQADDGFDYLKTEKLQRFNMDKSTSFETYSDFDIPNGRFRGELAEQIDIRPPQQVLTDIVEARVEHKGNRLRLNFNAASQRDMIWLRLVEKLKAGQGSFKYNDRMIKTDWFYLQEHDKEAAIKHRFIASKPSGLSLDIQFAGIQKQGKIQKIAQHDQQAHNVRLANELIIAYDAHQQSSNKGKVNPTLENVDLVLGKSQSGLDVIIVRSTYVSVWNSLLLTLPKIGFTIDSYFQSEGKIDTLYDKSDSEFTLQAQIPALDLEEKVYNFLIGDLKNRTSILILDVDGKTLEKEKLQETMNILSSALKTIQK